MRKPKITTPALTLKLMQILIIHVKSFDFDANSPGKRSSYHPESSLLFPTYARTIQVRPLRDIPPILSLQALTSYYPAYFGNAAGKVPSG
jgi:hypothetical protein